MKELERWPVFGIADNYIGYACKSEDVQELEAQYAQTLKAAEQVVEQWDSPLWAQNKHTAVFINDLRQAITNAKGEQP